MGSKVSFKKYLLLFLGSVSLLVSSSCTSDSQSDYEEEIIESVEFKISIEKTVFSVDEIVSLDVVSEEIMKNVCVVLNNSDSLRNCQLGLTNEGVGTTKTINMSFIAPGDQIIAVQVENLDGAITEKQLEISVVTDNSLAIKVVRLTSFKNINESWDPEFPDTDENRLADLKFVFRKKAVGISFDGYENYFAPGHLSDVLENQGNLEWNLSDEPMYLKPDRELFFSLVDVDGDLQIQDILQGPPSEISFPLGEFQEEKPAVITLERPELELSLELEVEWF